MKPPSTLAVVAVLAFGACDSSAPSSAARIEQYIQAYAENRGFDGAILIAEDGEIVYEAAMGYADFDASRPNRTHTAFPLASISKLLTATAVLRLVETGSMGYEFMATSNPLHLPLEPRYEDAKTVFALNLQLFPESWNAHDSYGEALLATGDTARAIELYEKSLSLNPGNANGRSVLQRIGVAGGDDDEQPESRRTGGGAP